MIFKQIPHLLSKRFQTSKLPGEFRKRELSPAVDLAEQSLIAHRVIHTAAHGMPLAAQVDLEKYKLILLDIALSQRLHRLSR